MPTDQTKPIPDNPPEQTSELTAPTDQVPIDPNAPFAVLLTLSIVNLCSEAIEAGAEILGDILND